MAHLRRLSDVSNRREAVFSNGAVEVAIDRSVECEARLPPRYSAHPKSLNPTDVANGKRSQKLAKPVAVRMIEQRLVRTIRPNSDFEENLSRAWTPAAHAEGANDGAVRACRPR
jgi:hypothetical protein